MIRRRILMAIAFAAAAQIFAACATTATTPAAPCSRYHHSWRGGSVRTHCGAAADPSTGHSAERPAR